MIERRGMALIDVFHMFVFLYVNTYCNTVFIFKKKILVARIKKRVYNVYMLYIHCVEWWEVMHILISNNSKEPIYEQITNQVKSLILSGELTEGQAIPSMRTLAKDLQISVITTKRAYKELEESGYIYSVVGKGSFVAEQNVEMIREKKLKIIEEQLQSVIENSKDLGVSLEELQQLLKILYEE